MKTNFLVLGLFGLNFFIHNLDGGQNNSRSSHWLVLLVISGQFCFSYGSYSVNMPLKRVLGSLKRQNAEFWFTHKFFRKVHLFWRYRFFDTIFPLDHLQKFHILFSNFLDVILLWQIDNLRIRCIYLLDNFDSFVVSLLQMRNFKRNFHRF